MTTFRQLATHFLTSRGLTTDDASEILDHVIGHNLNQSMLGQWDEDADGPPQDRRAVVIETVRQATLEWMDKYQIRTHLRDKFVATAVEPLPVDPDPIQWPALDPVEPR